MFVFRDQDAVAGEPAHDAVDEAIGQNLGATAGARKGTTRGRRRCVAETVARANGSPLRAEVLRQPLMHARRDAHGQRVATRPMQHKSVDPARVPDSRARNPFLYITKLFSS